ncbi:hypothetical protein Tco_0783010, partial [Tanacetum coccineum]
TSSVTPTPEHEDGGHADSLTGPNLCTQPARERFVVLSDSSHYSSNNVADDEVTSIARSLVLNPAILTTAIATTVVADTSALVPRSGPEPVHHTLFADSTSMGEADADVAAAHQTCLSFEVRLWLEHELRGRKIFKGKCAMQAGLLKEKDVEIANIKAQLSLKEAEAAEAICLCSQIAVIEVANVTRAGELESLKEQNVALEGQLSCDDLSIKASTLECEKDKLVDQVSELEVTCFGLRDEVAGYKLFKEQILSSGLKLMVMKCLKSPGYLAALGGALGRAIDKGMQDDLKAGVDHGRAGRGLDVIAAYDPSAEANFVSTVDALPYGSHPPVRGSSGYWGDLFVLCLDVAHSRVQRLKEDVTACRLSLTDAMVLLLDPLYVRSLTGEASTSIVPATAMTTALSTTFIQASTVPPVPSIEVPSSPKIMFKQEELDTTPEHTLTL